MNLFTKKMIDWTLLDSLKFIGFTIGGCWAIGKFIEHKEKTEQKTKLSEDEYENDTTTETVEEEPWEKS